MDELAPPPGDDPFAPRFGDRVEREAWYVQDPVAGSKRLQAGSLLFDNGEVWIVSYRPIREHFPYHDKRVKVRGRPYWNSPLVQSVQATHFELEHIEFVDGEIPDRPLPEEMPAPPQVRTRKGVTERPGRWAHCVGELVAMGPAAGEDGEFFERGSLRLDDGFEVNILAPRRREFGRFVGQQVTVLGKIVHREGGGSFEMRAERICPGVVERCGMTMDNVRSVD